ncbi:hypothetical protein N9D38_10440 [Rubripirellula sp.]|nr:hypothetical protein [Rubripirellula sp.]
MLRPIGSALFYSSIAAAALALPCDSAFGQNQSDYIPITAEVLIASPLDDTDAVDSNGGVRKLVQTDQIPQAVNGSFKLPELQAPSTVQDLDRLTQVPKDFRNEQTVPSVVLPESGVERDPNWDLTTIHWEAANTFSSPRYFEDRMLERHGREPLGKLQPLASGARFFTTIPLLPYLMTVSEPQEKEYSLGYYRSGDSVPALRQRPPYERKAVVAETAAVSGLFLLVP